MLESITLAILYMGQEEVALEFNANDRAGWSAVAVLFFNYYAMLLFIVKPTLFALCIAKDASVFHQLL